MYSTLCRSVVLALVMHEAHGSCVTPGANSFDMFLPYTSHNMNITVPPVPTDVNQYAYATNNAIVAIPASCVQQFGSTLGVSANLNDRQPGGPTGMAYMRISNPTIEYPALASMQTCACGLVVLMHGTTGVRWQSASYAAMMAGMGYLVVLPDSHAMPNSMGLKGKRPLKATADIDTSNHCGAFEPYEGSCGSFSKPFCYSTKVENIVNDAAKYKDYVERNYLIRKLELDYFVQSRTQLLAAFSKVFLFGRSEGAMVASRYHHADLDARLSGRILSGWSCEFNYFVSCEENAKICGNACSKTVPQLNVNGQDDSYFSSIATSVSSRVAADAAGYGGTITGNCRQAYDNQGFTTATVVDFPGVSHSIMYSHDNALRSVLADFLAVPEGPASEYASLNRDGCTLTNGVYECDALVSNGPPCTSYTVNTGASWEFRAVTETCPPSTETSSDTSKAHETSSTAALLMGLVLAFLGSAAGI